MPQKVLWRPVRPWAGRERLKTLHFIYEIQVYHTTICFFENIKIYKDKSFLLFYHYYYHYYFFWGGNFINVILRNILTKLQKELKVKVLSITKQWKIKFKFSTNVMFG